MDTKRIAVINSEPLDGRTWTIIEPTMDGMGWHIVRVEQDCYSLTTMAVAETEQAAADYIRAQWDA